MAKAVVQFDQRQRVFALHRPVHGLFFLDGQAAGFREVCLTVHVDQEHTFFSSAAVRQRDLW